MSDTQPTPHQPTLKQLLTAFALVQHIADAGKDSVGKARTVVEQQLRDFVEETGTRSITVQNDGAPLGLVTAKQTKDKYEVADREALIAWLEENRPSAIETEIVTTIRQADLADLTNPKNLTRQDDGTIVYKTGEPIPGLKFTAGGQWDGFAFGQKNQDNLAALLESADLYGILAGESPALDATPTVESTVTPAADGAEVVESAVVDQDAA